MSDKAYVSWIAFLSLNFSRHFWHNLGFWAKLSNEGIPNFVGFSEELEIVEGAVIGARKSSDSLKSANPAFHFLGQVLPEWLSFFMFYVD